MSFVIAAPDMVQAAAENLAGIRSMLSEASASAAGPTTAVAAAAEDQVSAAVAALFGSFGQDYQAISAQAEAFHGQFVNLLNAGAGAYLSAESANAQQALACAVNAPTSGLLGSGAGVSAAAATSAAVGGIVGPYETLFANTAAHLQSIGTTWTTVTAPALFQSVSANTSPQMLISAVQGGGPAIFSTAGRLAQGYANLIQSLTVPLSLSVTSVNPPSLALGVGLPQLLAFDALGAPVNAAFAASSSGAAILSAIRTGDPLAALAAVVDAPANIADAFLNGETTLPVPLGSGLTLDLPFSGLLAPLQPFSTTATLPGNPVFQSVTITAPPIGGLVPALLQYTPLLLASALGG